MTGPGSLPSSMLDKYHGDEIRPLYTGRVRARGGQALNARASGVVRSDDGMLSLDLRLPREMGGPGGGTNPEQLLAAAYASCFHGALELLAARAGLAITDSYVDVAVTFARDPVDGLYLVSAEILVSLPEMDATSAAELVRNTERICPYSKLFQRGISHRIQVRVA